MVSAMFLFRSNMRFVVSWISFGVVLVSLVSFYFVVANNESKTKTEEKSKQHNKDKVNEADTKDSQISENSGKQTQHLQSEYVVELTQEDLSADDDDYVSKYIPTVAPATPQVLATPSLDFIDGIHSSVITEVVPLKQNEEDSLIIKTEENKGNTNDQEDSGEADKLNLLEIEQNNSSLSQKQSETETNNEEVKATLTSASDHTDAPKDSTINSDVVMNTAIPTVPTPVVMKPENGDEITTEKAAVEKETKKTESPDTIEKNITEDHRTKLDEKMQDSNISHNISIEPSEKTAGQKMLSFSEWQKQIDTENEEQDVIDVSRLTLHGKKPLVKKKNKIKKNYASIECGAKVIAYNDEASNPIAVLKEDKDIYMLNPCTVNAWFVVELCERIQVDSIDLANFEMFSSTPELFDVFGSSRFPTREWERIGSFQAKPEKKIQNFAIEENFYAKYIKIEIKKYFGNEHYCPLSLLRVFGTTEVEQFEDDQEEQDGSNEETNKEKQEEQSSDENIFTAAKNVVVDIVSGISKKLSITRDSDNNTNTEFDKEKDIITLLNHNETLDLNFEDASFNYFCKNVSDQFNASLNPHYLFYVYYMNFSQKSPSEFFIFNTFSKKQKKISKSKTEKRHRTPTDKTILKDFNETVIPIPRPPTLKQGVRDNVPATSQGESNVESELKEEISDIAKTFEVTKTCEKETTSSMNVRKILEPTLLPFASVTTDSTQSIHMRTSVEDLKRSLDTESTRVSEIIISTSSAQELPSPTKVLDHVDILEFKVDDSGSSSSVIAQKLYNDYNETKGDNTKLKEKPNTKTNETNESNIETIRVKKIDTNNKEKVGNEVNAESSETMSNDLPIDISSDDSGKIDKVKAEITASIEPSFTETVSSSASLELNSDILPTPKLNSESLLNTQNEDQTSPAVSISSDIKTTTDSLTKTDANSKTEGSQMTSSFSSSASLLPSPTSTATEHSQAPQSSSTSSSQSQAQNSASSTKISTQGLSGSKESVILKLNAKVKALQSNLTLSMMYLEEMSQRYNSALYPAGIYLFKVNNRNTRTRYRTAVEEVDKRHEQKYLKLNSSIRNQQEIINYQGELIKNLTSQIHQLTEKMVNLSQATEHHHQRISESHIIWLLIETAMVIVIIRICRSPTAKVDDRKFKRSNSAPVIRADTNGTLKRPMRSLKSESDIVPSNDVNKGNIENNLGPLKKKRRKKSKITLPLAPPIATHKEPKVSRTAGVLFCAGKGLISGLAGAFYWRKDYYDEPSRQAKALIDDIPDSPSSTSPPLRRSKSHELPDIDEVDTMPSYSNGHCNAFKRKLNTGSGGDKSSLLRTDNKVSHRKHKHRSSKGS